MDCREFEYKLWEHPDEHRNRAKLPEVMTRHLEECPGCAGIYAEFAAMFDFASDNNIIRDGAYWDKFDEKVWHKINAVQTDIQLSEKARLMSRYNLGFGQLLASLGIAAATVTMLMLAITNITDQSQVPGMLGRYDKQVAARGSRDLVTQNVPRQYNVIFKRDPGGGMEIKDFSLLPEPEVNIADDSSQVSIEAAYLTQEGLEDEEIEVTRALSRELVMGKGVIDTSIPKIESSIAETPDSDYVITVEKMPKMIKAVPPSYPPFAFELKRSGEVWIKARIDADGGVEQAIIHRDSGTNYGFEEAALTAAYKNKFEPFEINGKKLPVWIIYKVKFVAKN